MEEQEIRKILASQLSLEKLKDFNTTIIIGQAMKVFKKMLKSDFFSITKADEVREFLNRWDTPTDQPIIFEDLSLMTPVVQTYLLKFIEEPPAPLIILASSDNVSPIILSRCKRIIKLPEDFKFGTDPLSTFVDNKNKAKDEINTLKRDGKEIPEDLSIYFDDIEKASLLQCPDYLYLSTLLKLKNSSISNPDKYINIL